MLIPARRISSVMFLVVAGVIVHRAHPGLAAESPNDRLALSTQRVVVFKDGYYLAVKHGTAVTNKEGELSLDDVPDAAVLGSMWATSAKGKLLGIVASRETVKKTTEKEAPCTQTLEVLQANIGKQARIVLLDKTIVQGKIRTVLAEPTASAPTPLLHDLFRVDDDSDTPLSELASLSSSRTPASSTTVSGISGSQFILSGDDGDVLLSVGQIGSLTIKDMKATLMRTLTKTESPKRLTFRFAEANQPVDLSLMYFRPGLRWIPTYRVSLLPDEQNKMANLAMQAEFLNEAEDLDNVPVDIVVGVPNFRFRDTPSPLVLEATMRNVLQQAAPQLMGQQMMLSNSGFGLRSGERRGQTDGQADGEDQLVLPAELGAAGAQDLFVYSLPKLKLRRGQRAAMPILTADVPYRDLYTWAVHDTRRDTEAVSAGQGVKSPLQLSENRVWHQLVLSNTTRVPWTTGAAMILQGTQPLGQDLLTYTSPGSEVRLPVTVSVDTRGSFDDEETDRKLNDMKVNGHNYARISKSATLTLSNRKSIPVDVEVTFRTGGRATEATHDGKITLKPHAPEDWLDYHGYSAVNNSSTVVWKATLKPGESFA
ncbi:MAG: hypothetical protein H7062_00025, partial [Candidatus Saccharimonas sp.]|nr:hypothetical protein [Planctomycetaceae bacterium]